MKSINRSTTMKKVLLLMLLVSPVFGQEKYKEWVENKEIIITLSEEVQNDILKIQEDTEKKLAELQKKWDDAQQKAKDKSQQFPGFKNKINAKLKDGHKKILEKQKETKKKGNDAIKKVIDKNMKE